MLEIWHNPRCSKSRATLGIIEAAGVAHRIRRYLDDPPSAEELDRVLVALGLEPAELIRMSDALADELGLAGQDLSRSAWIEIMTAHPSLIERPVVSDTAGRAVVGRPPENVRSLL